MAVLELAFLVRLVLHSWFVVEDSQFQEIYVLYSRLGLFWSRTMLSICFHAAHKEVLVRLVTRSAQFEGKIKSCRRWVIIP